MTNEPNSPIQPGKDPGHTPPELPSIITLQELLAMDLKEPPEIISGILHQGCKMVLAGTSKSNKSWSLIDLALSVAVGVPWWGRPTAKAHVLYLNFELPQWSIERRVRAICHARPELNAAGENLAVWNLRGHSGDISYLRSMMEPELDRHAFGLIILDPAYKLLGNRNENANGDITSLMNELERISQRTGAAIVIAHHFAKGNCSAKDPIDRMCGAGVWARDPDSLLVLTPHEEPSCFTVTSILRNHPPLEEFVMRWDYPVLRPAGPLDPTALKSPNSDQKMHTDYQFARLLLDTTPKPSAAIVADARRQAISRTSVFRYLKRLVNAGTVLTANGLYWLPADSPVSQSQPPYIGNRDWN